METIKSKNRKEPIDYGRLWRPVKLLDIEAEVVVRHKLGLNLRTAAELVKVSSRFKSRVVVEKNGYPADGKSLVGLVALAVVYGSRLRLHIQGEDAPEALEAIRSLVRGNFGEKE